jgi:hypothetical protein
MLGTTVRFEQEFVRLATGKNFNRLTLSQSILGAHRPSVSSKADKIGLNTMISPWDTGKRAGREIRKIG